MPLIIKAPHTPPETIAESVAERAAILNAVEGKDFLLLPVEDPIEAITWAVASFYSPLAVVPISARLPHVALERLLAQLPAEKMIHLANLPKAARKIPLAEKSRERIWAVLFSSGSSGEQKGIALSGNALEASARAHAAHLEMQSGNWLLNLPLFHVGGFSVVSRSFFLGTGMAIGSPKFSAEETRAWIESGEISGLSLVPTTLRRLLALPDLPFPKSLKTILVGGAPLPDELFTLAQARNFPVQATYGMTEHASQIATAKWPGSGLIPLPGVNISVDKASEILVRSPCLASGFFSAGQIQPLPLEGGFFRTGDLGTFDGTALAVHGRKSDLILSGGLNIFPAEIEKELAQFPGLSDFAVTGLPDTEWGEVACAAYVCLDRKLDTRELRAFLQERLDARKVPKHFVSLDYIPRSSLGKVIRTELKERLQKKILAVE
ncbi:MAG: AMP-binding protein [Bacteriovoracia bacterium]